MKALFAFVLLYYFFGVQYLFDMAASYSPQVLGVIHLVVITGIGLFYYHFKTHEQSRSQAKRVLRDIYTRLRAVTEKYLFVITLVLFVLSTVAQIFWPLDVSYVGRFFAARVLSFIVVRDAFWQAKIYVGRHLFLHKESIFWLSVAATFLMLSWTMSALEDRSVFFSIYIGMMLYIFIIKRANIVRRYSIRKLFPTRLYTFALVVALLLQGLQYYPQTAELSLQKTRSTLTTIATTYRERTTQAVETLTPKENVDDIVSSEEVLGSGTLLLTGSEIVVETGDIVNSLEEVQDQPENMDQQITFTQALQHIFTTYQTPLSTATNIRFSQLSTSDDRYPLFKTAYEKRMLGSTVNPDAPVRCDVYLVMKGIAAGRKVTTQGNVFDTYWAAAQANDEVNDCERSGLVKGANL